MAIETSLAVSMFAQVMGYGHKNRSEFENILFCTKWTFDVNGFECWKFSLGFSLGYREFIFYLFFFFLVITRSEVELHTISMPCSATSVKRIDSSSDILEKPMYSIARGMAWHRNLVSYFRSSKFNRVIWANIAENKNSRKSKCVRRNFRK